MSTTTTSRALQAKVFDEDLAKSREYTLQDWQARPWHQRVRERMSSLVESQL